jgi:hypothetical protein
VLKRTQSISVIFIVTIVFIIGLVLHFTREYEKSKSIDQLKVVSEKDNKPALVEEKTKTTKELSNEAIPVYPNINLQKKMDTRGIDGEIIWYETDDPMEAVVLFFENELGMEYVYRNPGRIEFVLEKEDPSYTFELPNRAHPDEPGETFDEEFEVVWKSIVVKYEGEADRTIIVSQNLDRDDVMAMWQRQMEQRSAQIKRGPQLYVPPSEK